MQGQISFTLQWCSFLGWGNERVIWLFGYNANRSIHFGRMWQCSLLIAECVRLKIVDALLTLTLLTSKQPSYIQWLYAINRLFIIDIQYCVCGYYHLHPGSLLPLNFWSTSIHIFWVRDDVAPSQLCAFRWQFTAWRSFHMFSVNIARLPHIASCSSFSSISLTYHKRFQISQPCAPGLCGELCSRPRGWIQLDRRHSVRFILGTDPCF